MVFCALKRRNVTDFTSCAACSEAARHTAPAPELVPFDLESGVRVTCDVGYLCANFSLPRPLCSRLRR